MTAWDIFCLVCYSVSAVFSTISVIFAVIASVRCRKLERHFRKKKEDE